MEKKQMTREQFEFSLPSIICDTYNSAEVKIKTIMRLLDEHMEYLASGEKHGASNCNLADVSNNEVAVCGKCKGGLENHLDYLHCTNCDLWYEPQTDC